LFLRRAKVRYKFSAGRSFERVKVGRETAQTGSAGQDSTTQTVLVVEDFEDTRYLMRMELEKRGYRVVEAGDGAEGVAKAIAERPNIILMDIGLPVLDGIAATRELRQREEMRETLIVALTAHHETEYRANALSAGCDAYLTKPIDFDWLIDLLSRLLP
jgi:two-component system cell cycle response regulator DivK